MKPLVGMVMALPQEAYAIFGRSGWSMSWKFPAKVERLSDMVLFVLVSGQGPVRASQAARHLLESRRPLFVINLGVAGALVDGLESGDLLVPDRLKGDKGIIDLENPLTRSMERLFSSSGITYNKGALVSCSQTVDSPAAKADLHRKTGALAVDMEAFPVASACSQAGVPAFVVKSITDRLDQTLPKAVTTCISEEGEINYLHLVINMVSRPWLIPVLLEMQRSFKTALYSLEQVKSVLMADICSTLEQQPSW